MFTAEQAAQKLDVDLRAFTQVFTAVQAATRSGAALRPFAGYASSYGRVAIREMCARKNGRTMSHNATKLPQSPTFL